MTIQPLADLPRDAQANDPVDLRRLLRRWIRYARTLTEAGIVAYPTALMVETTAALDRASPKEPTP